MRWDAETLWEQVQPLLPGFTVEVLPQIDSTNSELMRRARAGQLEPTLLIAEHQTAGRGRLGRQWLSERQVGDPLPTVGAELPPPGRPKAEGGPLGGQGGHTVPTVGATSLSFSLGLPLSPPDWSGLSLAVGVSLARSLHTDVRLKWPNDLWLRGRKLAGILIETASFAGVRFVVIGVGINVAPRSAEGLSTPPAWLQELAPEMDAAAALHRVFLPLVQTLQRFEGEGFAPFVAPFQALDALAGCEVWLSDGTIGRSRGVDGTGALQVLTSLGLQKITSSEVSVRPLAPSE